jgi:hypothetical protein
MNSGPQSALRTLAFGALETGLWGAAVGSAEPVVAVGTLDSGAPIPGVPAQLDGAAPDADWELTGSALRLRVAPHEAPTPDSTIDQFAQLCRVTGTVWVDGEQREIECLGLRSYAAGVDLRSLDSVRQVLAWFAPDDGIALSARRPRGAKGHDRDAIAATVIEPAGPITVAEGRLSTTYAPDGRPNRMSLELWLSEAEEEFPRRVAGEALGVGAAGTATDANIALHPFRCHSRGRDGAGAYLVARPR